MYVLRKHCLLLLMLCACDDGAPKAPDMGLSPCEALLDRIEQCLGARPALVGDCPVSSVQQALNMTCGELLIEIGAP